MAGLTATYVHDGDWLFGSAQVLNHVLDKHRTLGDLASGVDLGAVGADERHWLLAIESGSHDGVWSGVWLG